jgi:hypothetical protein
LDDVIPAARADQGQHEDDSEDVPHG